MDAVSIFLSIVVSCARVFTICFCCVLRLRYWTVNFFFLGQRVSHCHESNIKPYTWNDSRAEIQY